jgi:hypothetical protein
LKLRCFIHDYIMQSHLHGAEHIVTQRWAENDLMCNQEHRFP